ncbi:hypothetical protein SAMN03080617_01741 [Algoriphagus alkaliphilus]|uniref:Uncharacterized protein n=2 Tax=Algoriphagus alkaliphilus TaxID=279824 RepID=A0A1G5XFL8_9BACT|nr:hypothetical protein SAMN03080617_01741 [Algoriphagus alkaliphilus]
MALFFDALYLVNRLDMGYLTKIQRINRAKSEQWYVNFPAAVAQAIEFQQGEVVEWIIDDHQRLVLQRSDQSVADLKKKTPQEDLKGVLEGIFSECQSCFKQIRTWQRAAKLVNGVLSCMGRSTITGWLTASGISLRIGRLLIAFLKGTGWILPGFSVSSEGKLSDWLIRYSGMFLPTWMTPYYEKRKTYLVPVGSKMHLGHLSRLIWFGDCVSFSFHCPVFQKWARYRPELFPYIFIIVPP